MTLAERLIEAVGREEFEKGDVTSFDLAEALDEAGAPEEERVRAAVELYRRLPAYSTGKLLYDVAEHLSKPHRPQLWSQMRAILEEESEPLVHPLLNVLFVDFFEDPSTVEEAWRELVAPHHDLRTRRVVGVSAPVPWKLKVRELERHADDPAWRGLLLEALAEAETAAYGQTDPAAARRLRERLGVRG